MMSPAIVKEIKLFAWIFAAVFLLWPIYVHFIGPAIFKPSAGSQVVAIYTASWCGYCKQLKRFLDAGGVDYQEYDIEGTTRDYLMFKSLGGTGVPLVVVGDTIISGYRPDAIALKLNGLGYALPVPDAEN